MDIEYKDNASYTIDEMIDLYRRSDLGRKATAGQTGYLRENA